jgi:hypothetical protein
MSSLDTIILFFDKVFRTPTLYFTCAQKNHTSCSSQVLFFFLQPVQDVDYPAATLCIAKGHDTGEYVRSIFNNFVFAEEWEKESSELKELFQPFLDGTSSAADGGFIGWGVGKLFIDWARYL